MQCPSQDSEPSQGRAMEVYHGSSTNEVSPSGVYDEESNTLTILKQIETLHVGKVDTVHVGDIHYHVSESVQDQKDDCDGSTSYQEDVADSGDPPSHPMTLRSDGGVTQTNPTNPPLTVVRTEFTALECLDLADLICPDNDFHRLGLCLGFYAPALSRYRRENTGGGCHGVYKMLVDWKKGFLVHEQRENLADALDNAGLKCLAFQVRYGQKLEVVAVIPPNFSSQSSMPSTSNISQPINPPRSLRSDASTSRPGPGSEVNLGPKTKKKKKKTLPPRNKEPSPENDVQDI